MIRSVSTRIGVAPPWHLRDQEPPDVIGLNCTGCTRDIAVPLDSTAMRYICIYCANDRGLSPIEETPIGEGRGCYYHEVTACH